jgi:hypothetical protein
LPSVLDE